MEREEKEYTYYCYVASVSVVTAVILHHFDLGGEEESGLADGLRGSLFLLFWGGEVLFE